jgi:hypothetical protein
MQPETPLIPNLGSLEEETLAVLRRYGSKRKEKSLTSRRYDNVSFRMLKAKNVSVRMLKAKSRRSRSLLAGVTSKESTLIKVTRRNDAATKIQALIRGHSA